MRRIKNGGVRARFCQRHFVPVNSQALFGLARDLRKTNSFFVSTSPTTKRSELRFFPTFQTFVT
jgi:hypothetical protein